MSEAPIKATLKAGRDYDAPWLTVDAFDPEDLETKLNALVEGGALEAVVNAANTLKAVNNAAPIAADVASPPAQAPAAPQQPAGWSNNTDPAPSWAAGQQQQAPQAPAAPQQSKFGGPPHPEGKQCEFAGCGKVLEHKKTSSGKATWRCPDWRWNSGNPNGHSQEWAS